MRSHSSSLNLHHHLCCLGFLQTQKRFSLLSGRTRILFDSRRFSRNGFKLNGSNVRRHGCGLRRSLVQVRAMDEDFAGIFLLDDWGDNEGTAGYMPPSSDGEDSDGEIILNPITDVDLPSINEQFVSSDDALRVTSHRFAMLGKGRKKHGSKSGVLINMGLITFLTTLILFVDWCAWKIVRLPLAPFHLTRPFFISAVLVSCAGYICVPLLRSLKIHQIFRKEGPIKHSFKKKTPTMGGLFFIPIGIIVAKVLVGFSSIEVSGAATATLAFAAVGLLDDILSLTKNHNNGLSAWIRILLEVAVGMCFSFWLDTTSISSPYGKCWFLYLHRWALCTWENVIFF